MLQRDAHFTELKTTDGRLELPDIPAGSGLAGAVIRSQPISAPPRRFRMQNGLLVYCPSHYRRQWIALQGTFDEYMTKFSSKTRSTLTRKVRRFREAARVESILREFKHPDEMDEFFRLGREVSRKTYQERLLDAGLPAGDAFRAGLVDLARRGRVRGFILSVDERPVAYLYCPMYRESGILFYSHLGYDPEYEHLSPGTVLQYLALERLFAQDDVTLFDFLEGENPQKELFATGSTLCGDFFCFRPTLGNACLVLLRHTTDSLSRTAARILAALRVKRGLKRLIRRRHAPAASG
jgi:CelD/BcsL family acetyltransferase involved in cellulose biosynthesis